MHMLLFRLSSHSLLRYFMYFLDLLLLFFFFNRSAATEIYTLSLHDALPICDHGRHGALGHGRHAWVLGVEHGPPAGDRKSTRLNSSHVAISYAVFCLKKKNSYV